MVAIKLPTFAGMVPAVDPHLISPQHAKYSKNTWLYSGALTGYPKQVLLHELVNSAAQIAYRIPSNLADPTYLFESIWLEFENPNTDFISAPIANDTFRRFYWASSSDVPRYNTLDRIQNGDPSWILGVPQPGDISVSAGGGSSGTQVSRAYLTTLITEYGEEGPASVPFLINGKIDDTYTVTVAGVPANDMGVDRNVNRIRLYRTIVSSSGVTTYYLVHEFEADEDPQVFEDSSPDNIIASRSILRSIAWAPPPNLNGLATMPNGIVAGFVDNELWFSEPYRPHAWPPANALSIEHDIVGLAVIGQTLVVCTVGNPVTASGVNPTSITTSKLAAFEPCLSKGSILPTEDGVYYISPNGLILVNPGYVQNVTKQFISREDWLALASQAKVNASRVGTAYYAFGTITPVTFQNNAFDTDAIQLASEEGATEGFAVDPQNQNAGFSFLEAPSDISSVRNDVFSGETMLVRDGGVYWLDQRPGFDREPYIWKSKPFQTPSVKNFSAYKLFFYEPEGHVFTNPPNNDINQVFDPDTQLGVLRVYADGRLILAHEIRNSGQLKRLPSGFKADFWEVEFEARVTIKSFQMATAAKELAHV